MSNSKGKNVIVIGVGNVALSDEGVGSRIIREITGQTPEEGVDIIDAGLPGHALVGLLEGRDKAIIVDAIDAGRCPGEVFRFRPNEITPAQKTRSCSLHEGDILQYVALSQALGDGPEEVVFIGVQPKNLTPGKRLSPPVERAVTNAAKLVLAETNQ